MPVSCEPDELVAISTCYTCISGNNIDAVKIYLLAVAAGLQDMTPQELVTAAKCYASCIPKDMQKAVQNYLLCQIANAP